MQLKLWSSEPTLLGDWCIKLSLWSELDNFVIVAKHVYTDEVIVKSFIGERDVVNFVNFFFLGENYE